MSELQIAPSFDNTVDMEKVTLTFRTDKLGNKRPPVDFQIPRPSVEGIVAILNNADTEQGKKELKLLLDSILDTQKSVLRSMVNDMIEAGQKVTADAIDASKLLWSAIAAIPEKERAGSSISKEDWEAFVVDYVEVMPAATGKSQERVAMAASLFAKKLLSVKTNLEILGVLSTQLDIWFEASKNQEQFAEIYTFLRNRLDGYLKPEAVITADAL